MGLAALAELFLEAEAVVSGFENVAAVGSQSSSAVVALVSPKTTAHSPKLRLAGILLVGLQPSHARKLARLEERAAKGRILLAW